MGAMAIQNNSIRLNYLQFYKKLVCLQKKLKL